jgi:hypothetical protein
MGSSRHWNVARHILTLHEGSGEPVNEFGKTKEQCQIDMNLPFIHNHQNAQKLAAFSHDQSKNQGLVRLAIVESIIITKDGGTLWTGF